MRRSTIDALVREADPLDRGDVEAWLRSPSAAEARRAATGPSRRPVPVGGARGRRLSAVALAAAVVLVLGAAVAAAAVLLGRPAPPAVKRDLRGVDAGFPADLRYDPNVEDARSVAATAGSTLYYAELKDGGHCTEIVTAGVPRGAVCTTAAQLRSEPVEVTVPFVDPVTSSSPVTVGGRVNVAGASSVQVRYADGSSDDVALGHDGFFLFDVPADHLESVHASAFSVVALAADGRRLAEMEVPAVEPEPAGPVQDPAPITVDTISDGSDFTKVLGVRGRVNAEGAVSLELTYPDGTTVSIPLAEDGGYDFDIPAERQGELFRAPAMLVARDAHGVRVASAPVAAVAFWRAHEGAGG